MHPIICPSILAADFAHLGTEAVRLEKAGADRIHVDVMDGLFVPNLTIGPQVVAALNRSTNLMLDVHLMMYNPDSYVERFVESGADIITFHVEATEDVAETIDYIKKCGIKVGLALSPDTPPGLLDPFLAHIDQVLVMTVNPGFGGQAFEEGMIPKIEYFRDALKELKREKECLIQVDGGIDYATGALCASAGASVFVSGSFLFAQPDMKVAIELMRECCQVKST